MKKKRLVIILITISLCSCKVIFKSNLSENNINALCRNGVLSNVLYNEIIDMNNYIDKNDLITSKHIFVSFETIENQCFVLIGSVNLLNPEMKGYTLLDDKIISFVVLDNSCVNKLIQIDKLPKEIPESFNEYLLKEGGYYSDPWGKKYKLSKSGELEYKGVF